MRHLRIGLILAVGMLLGARPAGAVKRCPNVMIVVDNSLGAASPPGAQKVLFAAIGNMVQSTGFRIRYGLELFSASAPGAACFNETSIAVSTALKNGPRIVAALQAAPLPSGLDNAGDAIRRAASEMAWQDPRRDNVILLFTGGHPDCEAADAMGASFTVAAIAAAANAPVPVRTLVVANRPGDPAARANLDAMALAGGLAGARCKANNVPCYWEYTGPNDLSAILSGLSFEWGQCDDSCFGQGCPAGSDCVVPKVGAEPACAPNPCLGLNCPAGTYCRQGNCLTPCPPCGPDEICDGQLCRAAFCTKDLKAQCAAQEKVCNEGQKSCSPDLCKPAPLTCPLPLYCDPFTATCADDPCRLINCPPNATCTPQGYCMVDARPPPDMASVDDGDFVFPDLGHPKPDLWMPPVPSPSSCAIGHSRGPARGPNGGALFGLLLLLGVAGRRIGRRRGGPIG